MIIGDFPYENEASRLAWRQEIAANIAGTLFLDENGKLFVEDLQSVWSNYSNNEKRHSHLRGGTVQFRSLEYQDFHMQDDDLLNKHEIEIPTGARVRVLGDKANKKEGFVHFRIRLGSGALYVAQHQLDLEKVLLAQAPKVKNSD